MEEGADESRGVPVATTRHRLELDGVLGDGSAALVQRDEFLGGVFRGGAQVKHAQDLSCEGVERRTGGSLPLLFCRSPQPCLARKVSKYKTHLGWFRGERDGLEVKQDAAVCQKGPDVLGITVEPREVAESGLRDVHELPGRRGRTGRGHNGGLIGGAEWNGRGEGSCRLGRSSQRSQVFKGLESFYQFLVELMVLQELLLLLLDDPRQCRHLFCDLAKVPLRVGQAVQG
ncbi:uncharacterized protein LOC119124777 [Syngnathus acus]|uniref:uncharacterized protein LOC119124777 n=1 Tax=Syngnathus acus TaxID=161584 RepID=UPI0018861F02|nr:uncharacterized protein LOC119124777 [Syngnathus acus]